MLLSLGPQHSFPLADVFRYLHPATARDVLVQAFLDAPVFQTRWRWNTTISLAVPRNRNGKKVPPQLQRMMADDLMAAVFPDAAAASRTSPATARSPTIRWSIRPCATASRRRWTSTGSRACSTRIHAARSSCVARDTPEPSPLAHEILNARPYAFLDDAPLEERRTQAVLHAPRRRRSAELGALDPAAIARVRDEERPDPRDADELHDALLTAGFLSTTRWIARSRTARELRGRLRSRRAARIASRGVASALASCDRRRALPELLAIHPTSMRAVTSPPASRANAPGRARTRSSSCSADAPDHPRTDDRARARRLARHRDARGRRRAAGARIRGRRCCAARFERAGCTALEWCDRRLLARIHRYTLNRLRAEIEPVSAADFMRFLFAGSTSRRPRGSPASTACRHVLAQLDGFEVAASAWERSVLPARIDRYEPSMLDMLCLTGEVGWARLSRRGDDASSARRRSRCSCASTPTRGSRCAATVGRSSLSDRAHDACSRRCARAAPRSPATSSDDRRGRSASWSPRA